MDNVPAALALAALAAALVEEVQAEGKSLLGWAVILLSLSVLWGWLQP